MHALGGHHQLGPTLLGRRQFEEPDTLVGTGGTPLMIVGKDSQKVATTPPPPSKNFRVFSGGGGGREGKLEPQTDIFRLLLY